MNIEKLLSDTFADHEHLAPSEDEVLPAVRRRTRGRNLARPLAVAASVVVVAGAAYGIVTLTDGSGRGDTGAPPGQPGTHHPVSSPTVSHSHVTHHSAPADHGKTRAHHASSQADAIAAQTMPFDLGWLPDGSSHYIVERVQPTGGHDNTVFAGEYMIDLRAPDGTVYYIDVQQWPYGPDSAGFKSGPGEDVTINGQHAVESANSGGPGGYEVYFHDPQGGDMYINVMHNDESTGEADLLSQWGRRIADNIELPGTTQVQPGFGLGFVPDGLKITAWDVDDVAGSGLPLPKGSDDGMTSYDIGTDGGQLSAQQITVGTNIGGSQDGSPGRDVQGHPTRVSTEGGYTTLFVLDAVGGQAVGIEGSVPESELYQIADGLVLPGD